MNDAVRAQLSEARINTDKVIDNRFNRQQKMIFELRNRIDSLEKSLDQITEEIDLIRSHLVI